MTEEELAEIENRCLAASPLPWVSWGEGRDHVAGSHVIITGTKETPGPDLHLEGGTVADHDFIAHARQDVPRLIEEIRRLRRCQQ